ncbi:MAG: Hsp70 family protein [Desulfoplanes sp.]
MSHIYGIDLGTTNSCIAWLEDGVPRVVSIENSYIVPSVVSFDGDEVLVGQRAANRAVAYPEDTVASIKRSMGTQTGIEVAGRILPPEEISSYILRYLKHEAGKVVGEEIERVVITVPAYFSDLQRRLTRKAGEMAGFKVERIVNEPTAAALFYDLTMPEGTRDDKNVLVYDLGGGTFDVSILRMGELTEVLASTGNTALGGDDFDRVIVDKCLEKIREETGQELGTFRPALVRLKMAAEKAKIVLSEKMDLSIEEDLLPVPQGDPVALKLNVSREDFETWIAPYLEQTAEEIETAMREAGMTADDIDQCILVGGSTRIPAVISQVEGLFGASRLPVVDPDLCVAKGAAVQGGIISGEQCRQVLIDITAHSLGTEALVMGMEHNKTVVPIIPRNTQIPVVRAKRFYTVAENQEQIVSHVYQGESSIPEENTMIGELDLALAPAQANCPIIIEYSYDLDGIIHVRIEQQGYGRVREVDFSAHKQGQSALELAFRDQEEILGPDDEDGEVLDIEPFEEMHQVTNYIVQKAKKVLESLSDEQHETLENLLQEYADALMTEDDDLVDETEDALVEYMDDLAEK